MVRQMNKKSVQKCLALFEITLIVLAVSFDILIPTVIIAAIAAITLLLGRKQEEVFGFKRAEHPLKMIIQIFFLMVVWTLADIGLLIPLLNHITGTKQVLTAFENLKGNLGLLLFLLGAGWILAALGEEMAYRGYFQSRIRMIAGNGRLGKILAVIISSVPFGMAHSEQGIVGIAITAVDAVVFSMIRFKYDNLWASVLAHGFINSIGVLWYYFFGPIYSLW